MLLISITGDLCAQTSSDKTFEAPANVIVNRRFMVNLDKGNRMQLELTDISDLQVVENMDSLLQVFLTDIVPLKDSLADQLSSKRIDYITDVAGRKKIRFQQFMPKAAGFLIDKGELASLRTEQDTIHIIGFIKNPPAAEDRPSHTDQRYYHFIFYLNNISELVTYAHGAIKEKIANIQQGINSKWPLLKGTGSHYLKNDNTITADGPKGHTAGGAGDYLELFATVNVQNYKNYFVPSFSLGGRLTITNRYRTFKFEPGLFWEPHFVFAKDAAGKLNTYRNDFLTFTYAQGGMQDYDSKKDFSFSTSLSVGYLIHREGDYFDKNTFRLGMGKLKWYKTTIEPSMYFNNFFKGVTPGIRITQHF